jgi:hypothetical protein
VASVGSLAVLLPNPLSPAGTESCPAPSDHRAPARSEATASERSQSLPPGLSVTPLGGRALPPRHLHIRYGGPLALHRIPPLGACLSNHFSCYRLWSCSSITTTACAFDSGFWNTRTHCWGRWKSRGLRVGRRQVPQDVQDLIRKMSLANPLWGARQIHGELLKLGIPLSQATVAHYMVHTQATLSDVARLPQQSHHTVDSYRLLRSACSDVSVPVCLPGARPPPTPGDSFPRHRPSQLGMDRTPNGRGLSLGQRTALSAA